MCRSSPSAIDARLAAVGQLQCPAPAGQTQRLSTVPTVCHEPRQALQKSTNTPPLPLALHYVQPLCTSLSTEGTQRQMCLPSPLRPSLSTESQPLEHRGYGRGARLPSPQRSPTGLSRRLRVYRGRGTNLPGTESIIGPISSTERFPGTTEAIGGRRVYRIYFGEVFVYPRFFPGV